MKRTWTQRWRERAALVAASFIAANFDADHNRSLKLPDGVIDLIGRKETSCVVRRARAAECKLDGRTINVRAYDRMDAFTRQAVLSSGPVSISKLVPTLP
jgi:hypothetical protein